MAEVITVEDLNTAFATAIAPLVLISSNKRGTLLYQFQTDFSYWIDEIQRGPKFFIQSNIDACRRFVTTVTKRVPNEIQRVKDNIARNKGVQVV